MRELPDLPGRTGKAYRSFRARNGASASNSWACRRPSPACSCACNCWTGTHSTTLVHPSRPWVEIAVAARVSGGRRRLPYAWRRHILFGFDHLLFVLAPDLVGKRPPTAAAATVTAFTSPIQHHVEPRNVGCGAGCAAPVEATIALSILFLASELIRGEGGRGSCYSLGGRGWWPFLRPAAWVWLCGRADGVGLPQGDIPLALFAFNVGVELGQLVFIGFVLSVLTLARRTGFSADLRTSCPFDRHLCDRNTGRVLVH